MLTLIRQIGITALCSFSLFVAHAGGELLPVGARFADMGYSGLTLVDLWSVRMNPAGLAGLEKPTAGAFYQRHYLSQDLSHQGLALAIPLGKNTLDALAQYPRRGGHVGALAMHYANNDLLAARALVNDRVQASDDDADYWRVQNMLLTLKEQNGTPLQLGATGIAELETIAAADGLGATEAQAWLSLLGTPFKEKVILPLKAKRLHRPVARKAAAVNAALGLAAYPNPSNGPVYITYQVPDGVDRSEIRIHDASGREVQVLSLSAQNGVFELPERSLSAGMHVASLWLDGIKVGSAKVEVIR